MAVLSPNTLIMAIQAVASEMQRIKDLADGDIGELELDDQESLLAYSRAASELEVAYKDVRLHKPQFPAYEDLL